MWMQPFAAKITPEPSVVRVEEALGAQLKSYFDDLTSGPVPDNLLRLTEALEAAFERGELRASLRRPGCG